MSTPVDVQELIISELPPDRRDADNSGVPPPRVTDLPPPYTPTAQGVTSMINCKVCQALINIEGRQHQSVVKCGICKETTPIKAAPPGKRFARCQCNCLLLCKAGAVRIACPRSNCGRIVNLNLCGVAPSVTVRPPSSVRATCVYCAQNFIFDVAKKSLARCPHCRKLTAVGKNYARIKAHVYLIIALVFIAAGIGVTVGTYEAASKAGGIYIVWIGAFITAVSLLIRAIYFYTIRTSTIISET
ncbi:type I phosphatidylinositol 4,5-bisphosphate 4-phosphatase-A [Patella vulgata]|uniref:type I phosphatidylinositol 4,5-bisphosphate 4-phosphatase-A n=1 Tax=Patella vulgata TaxID=6465 RepID=UPI00217F7BA5|nr:type I phosphatidylinositol 4,5-bisphosphate 4-phosphatase-A [Patella vulgata]